MSKLNDLRSYAEFGLLGAKLRSKSPIFAALRPLDPVPGFAPETWSARRLNKLMSGMTTCTTYLEVGVQYGLTLQSVAVPFRWGVDPNPKCNQSRLPGGLRLSACTSDEFFSRLPAQTKFDLIFLDGLHEWKQTYRDLTNSLRHVHKHSIIVIDDVFPVDVYSADPDQNRALARREEAGLAGREWQGDVFKVMLALRDHFPWLDWGVAYTANSNAQAIIWHRESDADGSPPTLSSIAFEYDNVTYGDTFREDLMPDFYRADSEDQVITRACEGSGRISSTS